MKLNYLALILAMTAQEASFAQYPEHGFVVCPAESNAYISQDAWLTTHLQASARNAEKLKDVTIEFEGDFFFYNCQGGRGGPALTPTYFQPSHDDATFDQSKRNVILFFSNDDRRQFFVPIETRFASTKNSPQIHKIRGTVPLKDVLGSDYQRFASGESVTKIYNLRIGYPEVSSPTEKFTPKLKRYGASWGIMRTLGISFHLTSDGFVEVQNGPNIEN